MRIIAIALLVLSLAPIAAWGAMGGGMFTQEKQLVETVSVDDFGDEVKTQEWVEDFRPGLLDAALPVAVTLDIIGGVLFLIDLRRRRSA